MNEIWRPVASDGRYAVSSLSRVKGPSGVLKQILAKTQYFVVSVGRGNQIYVHRLVADAFVPGKTEERNIVNHKDGDKQNNSPANLEWCTRAENVAHARATGLYDKFFTDIAKRLDLLNDSTLHLGDKFLSEELSSLSAALKARTT